MQSLRGMTNYILTCWDPKRFKIQLDSFWKNLRIVGPVVLKNSIEKLRSLEIHYYSLIHCHFVLSLYTRIRILWNYIPALVWWDCFEKIRSRPWLWFLKYLKWSPFSNVLSSVVPSTNSTENLYPRNCVQSFVKIYSNHSVVIPRSVPIDPE